MSGVGKMREAKPHAVASEAIIFRRAAAEAVAAKSSWREAARLKIVVVGGTSAALAYRRYRLQHFIRR